MNFSIKDFFSRYNQIRRKLRIWSHILKKSIMENFILQIVDCKKNLLFQATKRKSVFIHCFNNFIEIALRHGCSPVNLLHIFRMSFYKNTYVVLLLKIESLHFNRNISELEQGRAKVR